MTELFAFIGGLVFAALVLATFVRFTDTAKFWRIADACNRALGRLIANERYICEVRVGLAKSARPTTKGGAA